MFSSFSKEAILYPYSFYQVQDTTKNLKPKLNLEQNSILFNSEKTLPSVVKTQNVVDLKPLPKIDSARFVKKKIVFINPITLPEYQKYKDVTVSIDNASWQFEHTINDRNFAIKQILNKKIKVQSDLSASKETSILKTTTKAINDNNIIDNKNEFGSIYTDWLLFLLVFSTIILGWIRVFYNKYLRDIIQAGHNNQWSKRVLEEKNAVLQRVSFFLNIAFVLNFSIFLFLTLNYYEIHFLNLYGYMQFVFILGSIIAVYIVKFIYLKIFGFIILEYKAINEYIHNVFLYNKIVGLVFFPIIWFIPFIDSEYSKYFIYVGLLAFVLAFLFRIVRGIINCIKINVSIFYIILYLCALEILPVLIIYRAILN